MSVVLSVDALAPALTGIWRYVWELAARLPDRVGANRVRFYRQGRWVADPATLLCDLVPSKAGAGGEKPGNRRLLKWPGWVKRSLATSTLRQIQKQCRGAVFHGPNYFIPPCADVGIATIHDLSVFKYPETHPIERIRHFEQDFFSSVKRASHLITDSEATRQEVMDYLGWSPEKITAVPLGVSDRYRPIDGFDSKFVESSLQRHGLRAGGYTLCVSTLEPRKKIGQLLKAYRRLPTDLRMRYPLVLVGGRGWNSEDLHQELQRSEAEGWLRYLGYVPEADLPLIYAGARTFAFPSVYEGFGLPVLEAMASGVPVVSSNTSSLPEVTCGFALLGDPDDVEELNSNLQKSLLDDAWRQQVTASGLSVARQFTWDACVDRTVTIYKQHGL